MAKSIRTHQQVAESIFGENANTRALTVRNPMGKIVEIPVDVPSRIKNTLLNCPNLAVRYRCILAAARIREDPEIDLSPYCRPLLDANSDLPNRKFYCVFIFQRYFILVLFADTFVKKKAQLPKFYGGRVPILDLQELIEAVNILNEEIEGEFWPNPRECFTLFVLNYNQKYELRRKLAGKRPLLSQEAFAENNIGQAVLEAHRRGRKIVKTQQSRSIFQDSNRPSAVDV